IHRLEIARRDHIDEGASQLAVTILLAFRPETPTSIALEWKVVGDSRHLDARNRLHASQEILERGATLLSVPAAGIVDLDRGHIHRAKSEVDVQHAKEAAQ